MMKEINDNNNLDYKKLMAIVGEIEYVYDYERVYRYNFILLLITHILACLTVGIIFRFWKYKTSKEYRSDNYSESNIVTVDNLGEVISYSIKSAVNTVVMIGGFVVLFSVITSMLHNSHFFDLINLFINSNFTEGFATGIIEITNGIQQICSIPVKNLNNTIIMCAFLLGFGGISVLLQVLSIISKAGISIKPYLIGKLLHGTIAAFYTFIILNSTSFFSLTI